jgi:hypothetical protein
MFRVTHPFHPLFGRQFAVATCRQNWGEDRVYFLDDLGGLDSLPVLWTDLAAMDPYVAIPHQPADFRLPDLLELARLMKMIAVSHPVE